MVDEPDSAFTTEMTPIDLRHRDIPSSFTFAPEETPPNGGDPPRWAHYPLDDNGDPLDLDAWEAALPAQLATYLERKRVSSRKTVF